MTDRAALLSDVDSMTRDFIEAVAALNAGDPDDAITDFICKVENAQGDLWKAAALVESEAAVETMRDEARDLAHFEQGSV